MEPLIDLDALVDDACAAAILDLGKLDPDPTTLDEDSHNDYIWAWSDERESNKTEEQKRFATILSQLDANVSRLKTEHIDKLIQHDCFLSSITLANSISDDQTVYLRENFLRRILDKEFAINSAKQFRAAERILFFNDRQTLNFSPSLYNNLSQIQATTISFFDDLLVDRGNNANKSLFFTPELKEEIVNRIKLATAQYGKVHRDTIVFQLSSCGIFSSSANLLFKGLQEFAGLNSDDVSSMLKIAIEFNFYRKLPSDLIDPNMAAECIVEELSMNKDEEYGSYDFSEWYLFDYIHRRVTNSNTFSGRVKNKLDNLALYLIQESNPFGREVFYRKANRLTSIELQTAIANLVGESDVNTLIRNISPVSWSKEIGTEEHRAGLKRFFDSLSIFGELQHYDSLSKLMSEMISDLTYQDEMVDYLLANESDGYKEVLESESYLNHIITVRYLLDFAHRNDLDTVIENTYAIEHGKHSSNSFDVLKHHTESCYQSYLDTLPSNQSGQ